jgi:hypothetical protein
MPDSFGTWASLWLEIGGNRKTHLTDMDARIEMLVRLFRAPVPGTWQRGPSDNPARLLGAERYTRGDKQDPHPGEHRIEHDLLCQFFADVDFLGGGKLVDGVNAFPLARDAGGGREGNVEADLLLLVRNANEFRIFVCELKHNPDSAWYAAVENLRQLKLFLSNEFAQTFFHARNPDLKLPERLPVSGLVLAPATFYRQSGRKADALEAVGRLRERLAEAVGVDQRLAVWDRAGRRVLPQ